MKQSNITGYFRYLDVRSLFCCNYYSFIKIISNSDYDGINLGGNIDKAI